MKKKLLLILVLALVLTSVVGCSNNSSNQPDTNNESTTVKDKIVNIAYNADIKSLDPQREPSYWIIGINAFDTLVKAKTIGLGESEIVEGVAERWDISDDGLTYTFYLRDDVYFHNGEKLTASDVEYTLYRMFDPKDAKTNAWYITSIKGANAYRKGEADSIGVKVIDENTVEIQLEYPYAAFLSAMACAPASILNEKATEEAGADFGVVPEKTIGSGPFKVSEWIPNDHYSIVKNENYWGEIPEVEQANVKIVTEADTLSLMFQAKEIDILDLDKATSQISYFKNDSKYTDSFINWKRVSSYFLQLNWNDEILKDVKVREAISLAINRQGIIDTTFQGAASVLNGILPPGAIGYNPDLKEPEYNVEKAKQLLAEAGYPNGFDMTLYRNGSTGQLAEITVLLQAMLREIGINANVETMDSASYLALRNSGEMQASVQSWAADFNDPDNFFSTYFSVDGVGRSLNYNTQNLAACEKVGELKSLTNNEERLAGYKELEKEIIGEFGWVSLIVPDHIWLLGEDIETFSPIWNGWADIDFSTVKFK